MTYPPIETSGEQASAEVALRLRRRSRRGVLLGVWNSRQRVTVAATLSANWCVSEAEALRGLELAASPRTTAELRGTL